MEYEAGKWLKASIHTLGTGFMFDMQDMLKGCEITNVTLRGQRLDWGGGHSIEVETPDQDGIDDLIPEGQQ